MNTKLLLEYSMFANLFISAGILVLMGRKHLLREFSFVAAFLAVNCFENVISIPMLFFRKEIGIPRELCYSLYFYSHWFFFFVEFTLLALIISSVFRKAMKPLEGLHRAGNIVFRWFFGVAAALSVGLALGPHAAGAGSGYWFAALFGQIQQGVSVLMICLLLFVCFTTRYLGLTYKSHIFGVSLGLGVFATASLIQSAWYAASGAQTVYSPIFLFSTLSACVGFLTWGTYFAMPEPERKMILLPTTSPYFLWNRIAEALGDEPGFVAIAGFKPSMLSSAELKVLTASSKWSNELEEARQRKAAEEQAAREIRHVEVVNGMPQSISHSMAMTR